MCGSSAPSGTNCPSPAQERDGIPTLTPQTVAYYVITYTHPETAELMTVRIEADRANSCDWLQDLGELVDYDSSSKGRAKVWDAIRHTSKGFERVILYESCGWRDLPGKGWTYLHSGGGITADGTIDLRVRLPDAIARIDLPDPITDPGTLRDLFDRHSLAMTTRFPGRVGAVLAGAAYRAVLGVTRPPTVLYGVPGTYKSAIAALTMHHFGTAWERSGASTSMSGHGATINALPELWYHAKDALFFGDDFAPDKSHEAAASFLSAVSRLQYNLEVRTRVNMRLKGGRGGAQNGFVTRTSQLLTSEVKASADSGDQRSTTVDLAKGEVQLSDDPGAGPGGVPAGPGHRDGLAVVLDGPGSTRPRRPGAAAGRDGGRTTPGGRYQPTGSPNRSASSRPAGNWSGTGWSTSAPTPVKNATPCWRGSVTRSPRPVSVPRTRTRRPASANAAGG